MQAAPDQAEANAHPNPKAEAARQIGARSNKKEGIEKRPR
jgi:hypothetical protein